MFINVLPTKTEHQRLQDIKVFYDPKRDQLLTGFITEDIFDMQILIATYQESEWGVVVYIIEPVKNFKLIGDFYE